MVAGPVKSQWACWRAVAGRTERRRGGFIQDGRKEALSVIHLLATGRNCYRNRSATIKAVTAIRAIAEKTQKASLVYTAAPKHRELRSG